MAKGNRVKVNWDERSVVVLDKDDHVVARYLPQAAHVVELTFDPNDPQQGLSYQGRVADEDREKQDLGKKAIQAAVGSQGAADRLLGGGRGVLASDEANAQENARIDAQKEAAARVDAEQEAAEKEAEAKAKAEAKAAK